MGDLFFLDLKKANPQVEDEDGVLTSLGMSVANSYASSWIQGNRDLTLERQYPELVGLFYDLRNDRVLAVEHSLELDKSLDETMLYSMPSPLRSGAPIPQFEIDYDFIKKSKFFLNPSFGKPIGYQGETPVYAPPSVDNPSWDYPH